MYVYLDFDTHNSNNFNKKLLEEHFYKKKIGGWIPLERQLKSFCKYSFYIFLKVKFSYKKHTDFKFVAEGVLFKK